MRGLVLMDAAPGRSLHDCIDDGDPGDAMTAAAALMQRLHEMPVDTGWNQHGPVEELNQLDKWRRDIAALYPRLADAVAERIGQLEARRPTAVETPVPVHGDFHDKQVLYSSERSTLIDCDSVSAGDPARDYGNLLAHVELRRLQHPGRERMLAAGLERFRARYPMSGARVRWWTASAFTRLCAVYALRPAWRGLSGTLLTLANDELEREVAEA
jgi:aminoglycoside phosphotransferase (APT) family kinase protein